MSVLTWEEVLERDDIVGGDLEIQEDGVVYRGPIASVEEEGDMISFRLAWVARMDVTDGWLKHEPNRPQLYNRRSQILRPQDIGEGRISFGIDSDLAVIFPRGGSVLDPRKVQGLKVAKAD